MECKNYFHCDLISYLRYNDLVLIYKLKYSQLKINYIIITDIYIFILSWEMTWHVGLHFNSLNRTLNKNLVNMKKQWMLWWKYSKETNIKISMKWRKHIMKHRMKSQRHFSSSPLNKNNIWVIMGKQIKKRTS